MEIKQLHPPEPSFLECVRVMAKYTEILKHKSHVTVVYEPDVVELLYLHGLVRLGTTHPGFQDVDPAGKKTVERFRAFCRRVWVAQGLTPKEAIIMDSMRETVETNHD